LGYGCSICQSSFLFLPPIVGSFGPWHVFTAIVPTCAVIPHGSIYHHIVRLYRGVSSACLRLQLRYISKELPSCDLHQSLAKHTGTMQTKLVVRWDPAFVQIFVVDEVKDITPEDYITKGVGIQCHAHPQYSIGQQWIGWRVASGRENLTGKGQVPVASGSVPPRLPSSQA
jgi:hypothetical protein